MKRFFINRLCGPSKFRYVTLFLSVLIFFSFETIAQSGEEEYQEPDQYTSEGKRIYETVRLKAEPPRIDGNLNDPCWEEGIWSGNYRQYMPAENEDPSQKTHLKILYDEENIYVAIRAFDRETEKIDRQLGRRDEFRGDIVGVCFDSYFDHRTGFEFDLTASGSKIDLILLNDGWDTNWDAVWYGKTGVEDSAWTAEFQIPLSQLRYGNKEVHTWGLHSWRWINRNQEEDQWNLMPRDNPGNLFSIGELHGISGITRKRKMELLPYISGHLKTFKSEPGNPYATGKDWGANMGIDGKLGISSDFTLDFTVNPDFGQVEADPSVLNLTAFEVFYEEKRPFFLEGKNILDFDFGSDLLFYSRRIGHQPIYSPELNEEEYAEKISNTRILGALKLTGKTKKGLSIGIIESLTAREQVEITGDDGIRNETVEPLTHYFIARVQKDIHAGNTLLGGMFTSTHRSLQDPYLFGINREAYTGGLDFKHFMKNKTFYLDGKMVFSYLQGDPWAMENLQCASAHYFQRPDADYLMVDSTSHHISGWGGSIKGGKGSNGKWRYSAGISWRSPGLDLNDVGYLQMADLIEEEMELGYVENEPKGIFRMYQVFLSQTNRWNFGGDFLESRWGLSLQATFANKWQLEGSTMYQGGSLDTRLLRGGPAIHMLGFLHDRYSISTDPSRKLSFRTGIHFHVYEDKISKMSQLFSGITYRLTNALRFSTDVDYTTESDNYQYIDRMLVDQEERYLLGKIDRETLGITLRADLAVTPQFTIQYYGNPYISMGNYRDIKKVSDPESRYPDEIYHIYQSGEIQFDEVNNQYHITESSSQRTSFTLENPDFNFRQFRSNLVARWEYKPGSTFYLVWTHGRTGYDNRTDMSLSKSIDNLFDLHPENVFLIKFNYWFQI
jgi:hypothetical protein